MSSNPTEPQSIADALLDSLAQTIDLARRCEGVMDADDLIYGTQGAADALYFAGHLSLPEWVEFCSVCWDMHAYPATIQIHDV